MDLLKDYKNITENTETLFSILIYDKSYNDVYSYFNNELERAKKITNIIKKNKINNRLYSFIKYLENNFTENNIINNIFLIHENIINHVLTKDEINNARLYNFQKLYVTLDIFFHIDYFIDLFYNFNFIYTIKLNKNELKIIKMNKYKEKELEKYKISSEQKIIDIIEDIRKDNKEIIIIYGISQFINKIPITKNILVHNENLNREEIYKLYENDIIKKNNILLEKRLDDILNEKTNLDLYIFGKLKFEIKDAIESYLIKELYIEDKKLDKLKSLVDNSLFNFKIIEIKSLENGDIAEQFIKNYNGIMAIKYY